MRISAIVSASIAAICPLWILSAYKSSEANQTSSKAGDPKPSQPTRSARQTAQSVEQPSTATQPPSLLPAGSFTNKLDNELASFRANRGAVQPKAPASVNPASVKVDANRDWDRIVSRSLGNASIASTSPAAQPNTATTPATPTATATTPAATAPAATAPAAATTATTAANPIGQTNPTAVPAPRLPQLQTRNPAQLQVPEPEASYSTYTSNAHAPSLIPNLPPPASSATSASATTSPNSVVDTAPEAVATSPSTSPFPGQPTQPVVPIDRSTPQSTTAFSPAIDSAAQVATEQPIAETTPIPTTDNASIAPLTTAAPADTSIADTHILKPGDRLEIRLAETPEYGSEQMVLADGTMLLPAIGNVMVQGLTVKQAEALITERYSSALRPIALTLNLLEADPIGSEVQVSDPQVSEAQVSEAQVSDSQVSEAQVSEAQVSEAQVSNANPLATHSTSELPSTNSPTTPAPSPVSTVPQALDVAIIGEIARPGNYQLGTSTPTLTQAIQAAGGITPTANIKQIQVHRLAAGGATQTLAIDLSPLFQTGDRNVDLVLQQGDTIVVPKAEIASATAPSNVSSNVSSSQSNPVSIQVNIVGQIATPRTLQLAVNTPLDQTTLTQAITAAGGLSDRFQPEVRLIRLNANGTLTQQAISIDTATAIGAANTQFPNYPVLQNNDVIVVGRGFTPAATTVSSALPAPDRPAQLEPLLRLL